MENALSEITLVLFTTLSPAGALAVVFIGAVLIFGHLDRDQFEQLSHYSVIPLVVTLVGLIASATHLGTPNHALYVLCGIGRSPLSNEVASAVLFLFLGGLYWLMTFSQVPHPRVEKIWQIILALSAVWFVFMIGRAYSVETIPTWNMSYGAVSMWCNGVLDGSLLAITVLHFAEIKGFARYRWALLWLGIAALLAGTGVLLAERRALGLIVGAYGAAADLVPHYTEAVVLSGALGLVGALIAAYAMRRRPRCSSALYVLAPVAGLGGCFIARMLFYALHMTVGL